MDNLRKRLAVCTISFAAVTSTLCKQLQSSIRVPLWDPDSNEPIIGVNVTL